MGELEQSMSSREFGEWVALFVIEAEEARERHAEMMQGAAMDQQRAIPFRPSR